MIFQTIKSFLSLILDCLNFHCRILKSFLISRNRFTISKNHSKVPLNHFDPSKNSFSNRGRIPKVCFDPLALLKSFARQCEWFYKKSWMIFRSKAIVFGIERKLMVWWKRLFLVETFVWVAHVLLLWSFVFVLDFFRIEKMCGRRLLPLFLVAWVVP
jgi:hypothetical protein